MGTRGDCQAIVNSVREDIKKVISKSLLPSDFSNALNQVNRDAAFREVEEVFPESISWVLFSYSSFSLPVFGDTTQTSETGFCQGDPLTLLLFSLVLHPVVKAIQELVPNLKVNAWSPDNGTQVGTREELQQVVNILDREGPARGLHP